MSLERVTVFPATTTGRENYFGGKPMHYNTNRMNEMTLKKTHTQKNLNSHDRFLLSTSLERHCWRLFRSVDLFH